jgi:hypothetical protein
VDGIFSIWAGRGKTGAEKLSGDSTAAKDLTAEKPVFPIVEEFTKWSLLGSIFTLRSIWAMDEVWNAVVAEALERGVRESGGRAVSGAKLRQLVAQIATHRGASYPPPGFESINFAEFLRYFDSILIVLRRRAQDILVAPVTRPELLIGQSGSGSQTQIRDDIFNAFTRIPREDDPRIPWYDSGHDRFVWFPRDEDQADPALIAVPPASREQEIADRTSFVDSLELNQEIIDSLRKALTGSGNSALWYFSQILRDAQLSKRWHEFRFHLITSRIRRWSEEKRVPWRDNWLIAGSDLSGDAQVATAVETASEKANLKELLTQLEEDDLKRINVPLDIVLKLLRR